ncbi:MAG: hypothetical protein WA885_06095 [Phormidesmis sp.]
MDSSALHRLRICLHLVPVFGIVPSLWTLYGADLYGTGSTELEEEIESDRLQAASRQSVLMGLSCLSAIALFGAGASTQASQIASLRFLIASSFVGSGYFLLSLWLMFRVTKGQSIRLPGMSQLSRRLP